MGEGELTRLLAWHHEMQAVHQRLRRALGVVREALDADDAAAPEELGRDLLVYCRGFCAALAGHHTAEDTTLFPELEAQHPELAEVLHYLRQDHSMIASLLTALEATLTQTATGVGRDEVRRHLDGIGAIMESHFGYEERQLLKVLAGLDLDASREKVLGPL